MLYEVITDAHGGIVPRHAWLGCPVFAPKGADKQFVVVVCNFGLTRKVAVVVYFGFEPGGLAIGEQFANKWREFGH